MRADAGGGHMGELSRLQQAVAYQALYAAIGPQVKANGDGLRGEVDRELRDIYERTGAKTYTVAYEGMPMGTYSVVECKAEPEQVERVTDLADAERFAAWLDSDDGRDMACLFAESAGRDFADFCLAQGVVPDGIELRAHVTPAKPRRYKTGQIRVDKAFAEAVRREVAAALPALVTPELLLGDGE